MVKKLLKWFLTTALVLLVLMGMLLAVIWWQSVDPRQQDLVDQPYIFPDTLAGLTFNEDSLKLLIGHHKGLPEGFELAALLAYSAYPELREVRVDMIMTPYGPPMRADIDIPSLLGPKRNRRYVITLNNQKNTWAEPILMRSLPFDAQVGILAHELGHVAYYHRLSALEIAKWGLKYLTDNRYKALHERTTDLMPIYHGLDSQIYQYAYFVRRDPSCLKLYESNKGFMDTYYMTDEEIREFIRALPD